MNIVSKVLIVVDCDGKFGECRNFHQAYFGLEKAHLYSQIKELVAYSIRDAVNSGWFVDPHSGEKNCRSCYPKSKAKSLIEPEDGELHPVIILN